MGVGGSVWGDGGQGLVQVGWRAALFNIIQLSNDELSLFCVHYFSSKYKVKI